MTRDFRPLCICAGLVLSCGVVATVGHAQIPLVGVPGQQCASAGATGRMGTGDDCSRFRSRKNNDALLELRQVTGRVTVEDYPHAIRKQPRIASLDDKTRKALDAGLAAVNAGDAATATKDLRPIADNDHGDYAKALALLGLAQIRFHAGDVQGAIALQTQGLALDSLDNHTYFHGLESLAEMYIAGKEYAKALSTLANLTRQSGAQSPDVLALQGVAYYRLQKYPEAVAAIGKAKSLSDKPHPDWDRIEAASNAAMGKAAAAAKVSTAAVAKGPGSGTTLQNAIADDIAARQYSQALALLEHAHANGQPKDASEYMLMAKLYVNVGLGGPDPTADAMKAVSVLQEAMRNGIVRPGLAGYKLLGDAYALAGDDKHAVEAYAKASPDAKTGAVDFKRGVLLENLGQHQQAKQMLQQAIAKGGFNRIGSAYLALGNAEVALNQRTAAGVAYRQAEKDPATSVEAQRALKQLQQR